MARALKDAADPDRRQNGDKFFQNNFAGAHRKFLCRHKVAVV
jgi:hypothetical protein